MSQAIGNAMEQGASKKEILEGIKEEGLDPKDFEDILSIYDDKLPSFRRKKLGSTIYESGIPMQYRYDAIKILNDKVEKRKKQLRR